nr:unnamed protein product [Callosobruchus analis]
MKNNKFVRTWICCDSDQDFIDFIMYECTKKSDATRELDYLNELNMTLLINICRFTINVDIRKGLGRLPKLLTSPARIVPYHIGKCCFHIQGQQQLIDILEVSVWDEQIHELALNLAKAII